MGREPDILNAIDRIGLQERGTLRTWMTLNHDAFAERLERFKPDWTALAEVFAKSGLTDRRGNPPTAEATRKTWQRVRIAARANPAVTRPALPPTTATEQTRPPPPPEAPKAGPRTVQLRGGDGTPYNPKK
jgi:hypothetical protein